MPEASAVAVKAGPEVAIITGAASGIGWATARRFASGGYRVVVADLDGERARARAAELGEGHAGYQVDVALPSSVHRMIEQCLSDFDRLDVLINNAGRTTNGGLGLVDQPSAIFDNIFDVNFEGTMVAAQAAASVMAGRSGGSIVNVASGAAFRALPFRASYSASKAAVVRASVRLAEDVRSQGVRVNVVAPGFVRTELLDDLIAQGRLDPASAVSKIPLGRMGTPDDLAAAIHFVASQGTFTGSVLNVDGGSHAFGGSGAASPSVGASVMGTDNTPVVHLIVGCDAQLTSALIDKLDLGTTQLQPIGAATLYGKGSIKVAFVGSLNEVTDALLQELHGQGNLFGVVDTSLLEARGARRPLSELHHLIQRIGPKLLQQGTGSFVSLVAEADDPAEAGREAGLEMLVRTIACEWGPRGVRANSLRMAVQAEHATPIDDVAMAVRYLISPEADFVTGGQLDLSRGIRPVVGQA